MDIRTFFGKAPETKAETKAETKTNTSWKWTTRTLSRDMTSFIFTYPKDIPTKDVHAKLERWFPESFYDWTVGDGTATIFKNRWRWDGWVADKKADGTWDEWWANFQLNGGSGVIDQ